MKNFSKNSGHFQIPPKLKQVCSLRMFYHCLSSCNDSQTLLRQARVSCHNLTIPLRGPVPCHIFTTVLQHPLTGHKTKADYFRHVNLSPNKDE